MNATIIGTGNMARGIATRLLAGGNNVTLLGTKRENTEELLGTGFASAVKIIS